MVMPVCMMAGMRVAKHCPALIPECLGYCQIITFSTSTCSPQPTPLRCVGALRRCSTAEAGSAVTGGRLTHRSRLSRRVYFSRLFINVELRRSKKPALYLYDTKRQHVWLPV